MRTWLFLALAACNSGGGDDYAIVPGGGGISPSGGAIHPIDAGGDDGGNTIASRVCLVKDLRASMTACSPDRAGGLTVTVGASTATTNADGSFTIAKPSGTSLAWHVKGTNLVTTLLPYTQQDLIPAILQADFDTLTQENGFPIIEDAHGTLVVYATHGSTPLAGVTMALSPASVQKVFYDSDTAVWNETNLGTQSHGAFLAPDLAASTQQQVALTPPAGVQQSPLTVTIEDHAITFATQDL